MFVRELGVTRRLFAYHAFAVGGGSPALTAAGLWDEWKNRETGERLKSCAMIITATDDFAAEIHGRMPAFLSEEQFEPC